MAKFDVDKLYAKILKDVRIELMDEFDQNFQRKAFFDKPWQQAKHPPKRGSLMMRSPNGLRNSLQAKEGNQKIIFSSSKPYSSIHNEGGKITVTQKMKKFFWAMHYKALGGKTKKKDGSYGNNAKNKAANADAEYWKSMALMKTGSQITIPERRFIGNHHKVETAIRSVIEDNLKDLDNYIMSKQP